MKRLQGALRAGALAGACALFVYAAAPALSTEPYAPGAVDFEQRLDRADVYRADGRGPALRRADAAHRHTRSTGKAYRTAVIEAPARFDLVGLAGELRPLSLRAREDGGEWSEWVTIANGDPAWFGGADELQLETRGWRPRGTLHYVNVSGTENAARSLLTRFRKAINSAFIAATSVVSPEAQAAGERPAMVTRRQWGANREERGCRPRTRASYGTVRAAVIHHTVTASDYTAEEAPSVVLGICRYHRNANGWNDIGYNALVDRFGTLYVGRAGGMRRAVVGAHAQGFNAQTTGIAALGTHSSVPLSRPAVRSVADYLAWKLSEHGRNAQGRAMLLSAGGSASRYPRGAKVRSKRTIGHRDVGHTACPGGSLYEQIRKIRRRAQRRIDRGGPTTEPTVPDSGAPSAPPDGGATGGLLPRPRP